MLSRDKRLNLNTSFRWVRGGRSAEDQFTKIFTRVGDNTQPLVGISTSAKVFKKAVDRNRARRLISRCIELFYNKIPNNLNIVILPKDKVLDAGLEDLYASLKSLVGVK